MEEFTEIHWQLTDSKSDEHNKCLCKCLFTPQLNVSHNYIFQSGQENCPPVCDSLMFTYVLWSDNCTSLIPDGSIVKAALPPVFTAEVW